MMERSQGKRGTGTIPFLSYICMITYSVYDIGSGWNDTRGCVADNRTFCMISLLSVDCREVGKYGKVSVGRVIGLG